MSAFAGKSYWLIGASEGLGRALASRLHAEGALLVLSARSIDRLQSLARSLPGSRVLQLDVTDDDNVRQAAAGISRLDGLIYCAGAYDPMRTQDWDSEKARQMLEVNFTGALRVLGEVVPRFLKEDRGDVTLIGSLAGYHGLPASIGYGASKSALVSLAETLRFDLRNTGVTVRLVNPGFIKTRLTEKNSFKMPMLMDPEDAACRVLAAMRKTRFRTDFPAPFSWFIRSLSFIPDWLLYRGK